MDRSRKDSSLAETVSHVRHRVSLVRMPSNRRWTSVPGGGGGGVPDADPFVVGAGVDDNVAIDWDTAGPRLAAPHGET